MHGFRRHGYALRKRFGERTRIAIIPNRPGDIPKGTLSAILGPKQTGIGREGLLRLIEKYGL